MSLTPNQLFDKYKAELLGIVGKIRDQQGAAIPAILAEIATQILPAMMGDVGRIKSLDGAGKKKLIVDSVDYAITETFLELNKIPELAAATWDETLRDYLLVLIPPLINLLVSVEGGDVKFNKKVASCFSCCKA